MNTKPIADARKKMVLRYATLIAKGDDTSSEEKHELTLIEDQLHLTQESLIREATEYGLAAIK